MKKRIFSLFTLSAATCACSLLPLSANAQSLPAAGQSDTAWRHAIAGYLFAPLRTDGTSTINGNSVPIDMNLSEVLELLDFAASARYEAWKNDFGLIVDANYVGIEADGNLPGPAGADFTVDVRQKWLALLGAYRIAHGTYGDQSQHYAVDLQGGLRYNNLKQELEVGPAPTAGGDEGWWEPVIGARGMWRLNDKWTSIASLELGGFGAGGNDLQIGANLGFDYQPWEKTAITFGYRYYSMDYTTTLSGGTFAYDTTQHGPYVGVKVFF